MKRTISMTRFAIASSEGAFYHYNGGGYGWTQTTLDEATLWEKESEAFSSANRGRWPHGSSVVRVEIVAEVTSLSDIDELHKANEKLRLVAQAEERVRAAEAELDRARASAAKVGT